MRQVSNAKKGCVIYVADRTRLKQMKAEEFMEFVLNSLGEANSDKDCIIFVGDKTHLDELTDDACVESDGSMESNFDRWGEDPKDYASIDNEQPEFELGFGDPNKEETIHAIDMEEAQGGLEDEETHGVNLPRRRSISCPRPRPSLDRQSSSRALKKQRSERILRGMKDQFCDRSPRPPRRMQATKQRPSTLRNRQMNKTHSSKRTPQRTGLDSMGKDWQQHDHPDNGRSRGVQRTRSHEINRPDLTRGGGSQRSLRPIPQRGGSLRRIKPDNGDENTEHVENSCPSLSRGGSESNRPNLSHGGSLRNMRPLPQRGDSGLRLMQDQEDDPSVGHTHVEDQLYHDTEHSEGNSSFTFSMPSREGRGSHGGRVRRCTGHASDLRSRDRRALAAAIIQADHDDDDDSSLGSFGDFDNIKLLRDWDCPRGSSQLDKVSSIESHHGSSTSHGSKQARPSIFGNIFSIKALKGQKEKISEIKEKEKDQEAKVDEKDEKVKTRGGDRIRLRDSRAHDAATRAQQHSERGGSGSIDQYGSGEDRHRPRPSHRHGSPYQTPSKHHEPPRRLASDPLKKFTKPSLYKSSSSEGLPPLERSGSGSSCPPFLVRADSASSGSS